MIDRTIVVKSIEPSDVHWPHWIVGEYRPTESMACDYGSVAFERMSRSATDTDAASDLPDETNAAILRHETLKVAKCSRTALS